MAREFKLPDLGEGIHEGEIVKVLVAVGDQVKEDQPILEVETDKATVEIPSPFEGTVSEIRVNAGDLVSVGDVLLVFDGEAAPAEAPREEPARVQEPTDAQRQEPARGQEATVEQVEAAFDVQPRPEAEEVPEEKPPQEAAPARPPAPERAPEAPEERQGPVPASPSTRRLARELGVDLRRVPASGPGGRVEAEDVRSFAAGDGARAEPARAEPARPREEERPAARRPAGEEVSAIRSTAVPLPPLL
ncbi:MAG TPA: biotin/lipoyl-containing protein, partial [Anaerolineae bacterium]|nr:biotin/lipoyl-containing protein [Anaerolineae bacterium]